MMKLNGRATHENKKNFNQEIKRSSMLITCERLEILQGQQMKHVAFERRWSTNCPNVRGLFFLLQVISLSLMPFWLRQFAIQPWQGQKHNHAVCGKVR